MKGPGVAEFDAFGHRTGKVHRPNVRVKPGPRRNRSQYRVSCGRIIRMGKPVDVAPAYDVCSHCYPSSARESVKG